jgi:hypothetical protein
VRRSENSKDPFAFLLELVEDNKTWVATWNEDSKPFVWHKQPEQILERLGRLLRDDRPGKLSGAPPASRTHSYAASCCR